MMFGVKIFGGRIFVNSIFGGKMFEGGGFRLWERVEYSNLIIEGRIRKFEQ